jgi:hypothetical protein
MARKGSQTPRLVQNRKEKIKLESIGEIRNVKAVGVAKPPKKTYSYEMTNKPLAYILTALITGAVGFGVAKLIGLFV